METQLRIFKFLFFGLLLFYFLLIILYYVQTIRKDKEIKRKNEKARSFEAMAMLLQYLLTGQGTMDGYFERIETKKFIYGVRDILRDRFLEAFEKLEVHNDLTDIYKRGPNWDALRQRIIEKMDHELAKELYLHYYALEINNAFKVGNHSPEDRIRIAKDISLAVITKIDKPKLGETAEKIIKEFDLGPERTTMLMAEVIRIENGLPAVI